MELPLLKPSRRELLQMMGVGAAWLLVPGCGKKSATPYQLKFFTTEEADAVGALANFILPPDSSLPGGQALGAVEYIDRYLSAFDGGGPIFAGGPYSGREPYPTAQGTPSKSYPSDDFNTALPLDRMSEAHFKLALSGASAVPGGLPNASIVSPLVDLRDFIRTGVNAVMALSPKPLSSLSTVELNNLLNTSQAFTTLLNGPSTLLNGGYKPTGTGIVVPSLVELVCEAAFCAPEYGGNTDLGGWKIAHFEGDSQPLGFSWYNTATSSYSEDPNAPVSMPDPGADPAPIDSTTSMLMDEVFGPLFGQIQNGQKFF